MYNQVLVVCVISMVLWQTAFAFVIKDQQFTIDVTNSTQPVFENVSIAVDAASSAVVIDDEQSVQSVENETNTDETDQKKPNISTSFVQIEKTVEICPDDDDVKSTVENNKEEKESRDPLDDSDDEQDKPRHDKYSPPAEEDEADDPDDDD